MQPDQIQSFIINQNEYRGAIVHLDHVYHDIVNKHAYPPQVGLLLGKALAAIALLGQNLKQTGKLALQFESDGFIKLMIVEINDHKQMRGLVQWRNEIPFTENFLAHGKLAITLIPTIGERYQGIVPIVGNDLSASLEKYYNQSEQIDTHIILMSDEKIAAGLLLQKLPQHEDTQLTLDSQTVNILLDTLKPEELLYDKNAFLLQKLFHEHTVEIFPVNGLSFKCQCSHQRMIDAVKLLGKEDALDLLHTHHIVEVICEFCNHHYGFDKMEIEKIFAE